MLAFIELDYTSRQKVTEFTRDRYLEFREHFPQWHLPEWPEDGDRPKYIYPSEEILIELETDGPYLSSFELTFTVKRFKGAYFSERNLGRQVSSIPSSFGEREPATFIQISIPDLALLSINEVQVLEDACTEELQAMLDNGFRIIAVCPPNSQRRPDYILGRTKGR